MWAASLCVFLFHVARQVGSVQVRPGGDTQGTRTHRHVPLFLSRLPRGQGRRHAIMPSSESPPPFLGTVSSSSSSAGSKGVRHSHLGTSPCLFSFSLPRPPPPVRPGQGARARACSLFLPSFFLPARLSFSPCLLSLSLPLLLSFRGGVLFFFFPQVRTRQVSRFRRGQVCGAKEKAEETGGVGERECVFVLCRKREPVSQGGKEGGGEGGREKGGGRW